MAEFMHHLGIPTTRSLAIVGSDTDIVRTGLVKAGMLLRSSQTYVRFGTFEYFYYNNEYDKLKQLAQYVINESYPHLLDKTNQYELLFQEIIQNTATLIAKWQANGFCHGVLNTDNMSIAGLCIDYGPFSMLDEFDYGYVPNLKDRAGRYSYAQQVNISYWNLTQLGKCFSVLMDEKKIEQYLESYGSFIYFDTYITQMRKKLGLDEKYESDMELIDSLIAMLQDAKVDYTYFFRMLSRYDGNKEPLYDIAMNPIVVDEWLCLYDKRLEKEKFSTKQRHKWMLEINPKYILKNYMLEGAIIGVLNNDFTRFHNLLKIARNPFSELEEFSDFSKDTPEHLSNQGLSCMS